MLPTFLAFLAIVTALLLGAITRSIHRPRAFEPDMEALRREIERAEQQHKPRAELRKQFVEAKRKELEV